jgi:hypothetical protein
MKREQRPPCPTCGRPYAKPSGRLYDNAEERWAHVRQQRQADAHRRATHDRETLAPLLVPPFTSSDVARALQSHGRYWSEQGGVLWRWRRFAMIQQAGVKLRGRAKPSPVYTFTQEPTP